MIICFWNSRRLLALVTLILLFASPNHALAQTDSDETVPLIVNGGMAEWKTEQKTVFRQVGCLAGN